MKSKRLARSTDRARQSIIRSVDKARPAMIEMLEERQMLSLTIDLQVVGSSNPKVATVSSVGQVVTIDEYATISGTTAGTNDDLWEIDGSLLGTKAGSGSVDGNLSNTVDYPFNTGLSWSNGTAQDLNGDGDLDVGSNNNADAAGFIVARAGGPVGSSYGTVSGDSVSWLVTTLTYTVTKLNVGEATDVNWRFRDGLDAGAYDAIWIQDGNDLNDATGTVGEAAPVVISDPALIPPPTGSLSGTVSKSVNGTTSAFPGVTMYLDLNDSGSLTSSDPTSVTNSSGDYSFPTLGDGTYYLREVVPSGYKQTSPSTSPTLVTISGTDAVTEDFTDTATVTNNASIAGTVYKAATGTSTVGFSGVTVYLDLGDKGSFASGDPTATTSSSGAFSFTGLAAGTYDVRQEVPSGYSQTSPSSSPTAITLSAGQSSTGDNFTDTATGSIAGTVYKAASGASTVGFSGVTVYLDLTDSGAFISSDPSTTTSSTGAFSFGDLAAGTYYLREEVPSGYAQTSPSSSPTTITLTAGEGSTGNNFTDTANAVVNNASIAGTVYKAATGTSTTGFSGVTVYLDLSDAGAFKTGDPSTTTSSTGSFSFGGLAAGTYYLREEVPTGYSQTSPSTSPTKITLTAGQASTGDNFTDTATGSIAGTVYKAASGASTVGFSGVTVYLDLSDSGTFASSDPSTTTSSTGTFSFGDLAAGTYYLREQVPTGYTQTSPSSSPTTITLTAGQASTGDNFTDTASTVANNASIAGTVYKAATGTSTAGFSGVTVYLDLSDSGAFKTGDPSTSTSSTGSFSFTGLAAGTYYLREEVPTGYSQTSPSTSPTKITLVAGQASSGDNFTDTATGSIAGTVYKAASGASTVGFSGVTVYLDLSDSGAFVSGDPSTTTSSTGTFGFSGLAAGTYYLRQEVPSGYSQTSPSTSPTKITLTAGGSSTGDNFTDTAASYIPGSISGTVYVDKTGSGKLASGDSGIGDVEMYLDLNKDNKIDAGDPIVTTNSSGAFTFAGLAPGVYRLREVVLNGYSITNTSVGYFDVTIKSNYQITGENFLDKITTPNGVILSGNVFNDANDNGVRDAGETGLSGWVVYLDLNDSGKFETVDNNKTTDSNGNFSFVSLKAGTYYVRVIPVSGYTQTAPGSGYYKVTLVAGTPTTIDFGEHQTGATSSTGGGTTTNGQTLSGDVFEDLTGSGVQTSSDPGLGGWVVYCDLNDSGSFQTSDNNKTTTSNGDFSFVSLKPGTYIIRVIPESGYKETDPASGFYTVTLSAGGTVTGIDFGEEKT